MDIKLEKGGVCAPAGFRAAGIHCGIAKKQDKKDIALIASSTRANAAAVYTTNKVKAAPLAVTKRHLVNGSAQAIICNSGNANACNADGEQVATEMCKLAAEQLHIHTEEVIVASTGVIGQPLKIEPIRDNIRKLALALSDSGSQSAEQAIMTTDLVEKEIAVSFTLGEKNCKIGGIAKGSGMINPNMATMLAFITTDAAIASEMLQNALTDVTRDTFNMICVDGDTSTNDMAVILANGLAGNREITEDGDDYREFVRGLQYVCIYLARMMAGDGEGATKLLECAVTGAPDENSARILAKSVISSSLFKAAMFGADANWGRVLCAMGYAGADFDVSKVSVIFKSENGEVLVCKNGVGVHFNEAKAKEILLQRDIEVLVGLNQGDGSAVAWGCDLTYDYVKINGDYRS